MTNNPKTPQYHGTAKLMTGHPLGHRQLALLNTLRRGLSLVVPNDVARSLIRRGLASTAGKDAFVYITPDGLRAIADAADAGRISLAPNLETVK
jgi:propanediol dehydratase small subunit